jgi:hypothetical protein
VSPVKYELSFYITEEAILYRFVSLTLNRPTYLIRAPNGTELAPDETSPLLFMQRAALCYRPVWSQFICHWEQFFLHCHERQSLSGPSEQLRPLIGANLSSAVAHKAHLIRVPGFRSVGTCRQGQNKRKFSRLRQQRGLTLTQ